MCACIDNFLPYFRLWGHLTGSCED